MSNVAEVVTEILNLFENHNVPKSFIFHKIIHHAGPRMLEEEENEKKTHEPCAIYNPCD